MNLNGDEQSNARKNRTCQFERFDYFQITRVINNLLHDHLINIKD